VTRSHVALLRGINVGGRTMLAMADLHAVAAAVGLQDARTLRQSGNLVFHSSTRRDAELERLLEGALAARTGRPIDVMVRSAEEWATALAANPFAEAAARDPAHLVLFALKDAPAADAAAALAGKIAGSEQVEIRGREAYIVYPDGIGRSKLTNITIESTLGTRGTGRNWNTALDLAKMMAG
jgi:uncharacterized protein (DUF1697 family)